MKVCARCKEEKELDCFSPDKRAKDGFFYYCKECNNARTKESYWINVQESRKKERARNALHRERAREKCSSFWRTKRIEDPAYCLWAGAKARARKKNIPFNILREDIIIPAYCPILGIKIKFDNDKGFREDSLSIDKINPNLGYIQGNIQVISWRANRLKCDGTLDEFKKLVEFIERQSN